MADIKINDIKPAGVELFADSESFIDQLSDSEVTQINGGFMITNTWAENCCRTTSNYTDTMVATCGTSPVEQV